ncbi:hypothetical protein DXG03_007896 [Asterophora parasitica]|uniref:Uncharacterized protein n=1 Tax=Asterophora parasitica TaxID=117018 RepID=A0A9P7G215_9AGAR|nr:hypothetical protein DXG03_007896 [Asterophora parasitica]
MDLDMDEFSSFSPYIEEEDNIDALGAHSALQSHLPKESDRGPLEDILEGEHIYATVIHPERSAEHIHPNKPPPTTISLLDYLIPCLPSGMASSNRPPPKGPLGASETPELTHQLMDWADINALLTGNSSPIRLAPDTHSWLEQNKAIGCLEPVLEKLSNPTAFVAATNTQQADTTLTLKEVLLQSLPPSTTSPPN